MATIRDALLPAVDSLRNIPTTFGIRTTRVYIRLNAWNGGESQLGALTTTDTEITPRPKVEELGGGRVRISGVTPKYPAGGWLPATLNPADLVGQEHLFILVGPGGTSNPYRATAYDGRHAFGYTFLLEQLDRVRPNEGY